MEVISESNHRKIIAFIGKDEKWHFIKRGDSVVFDEAEYVKGKYSWFVEINGKRIEIDDDVFKDLNGMDLMTNDAN